MKHGIRFFALLAASVLGSLLLSIEVYAQPSHVDEASAKRVVRTHFSDLGYRRTGRSAFSARIVRSRLEDNIWRFEVRYGGSLPSYKGYVIVSALTGELIDSNVPSGCKVAAAEHVVIIGSC